ncbi:uncharacterized protein LOC142177593 [Nicotiana tabacum]|uniref:Uncharacterized protein LOC142177593 n=1 Tax=Nicotiana tabacum TaxID=4097 RepID=A0AC58U095_TOBAC
MNQAYATIVSDGSQKSMAANAGILGSNPGTNVGTYDTTLYTRTTEKFKKSYNLYCDYCKLKGHTKENYYKLVGYPQDFKPKMRRGTVNNGNNAAYNVVTDHGATQTDQLGYNEYTIVAQQNFLCQHKCHCASSSANVAGIYNALLASSSSKWIIDIEATSHMVADIDMIDSSTARQPQHPKKVYMTNGDLELFSGKMKEIGRESCGLYIFECSETKRKEDIMLAARSEDSQMNLNMADVAPLHKRFGHVSTKVLKKPIHVNADIIASKLDKCIVCPCAKQTRLPFPTSIKSSDCFDLIHMDLWDPYRIATYDGNKYFLTIVTDYSRMTWVFLLKLKSDNGKKKAQTNPRSYKSYQIPSYSVDTHLVTKSSYTNLTQPEYKRSSRDKQPPIWMKDFVCLNVHQEVPYAISKYVSYEQLSSTYQAYIATTSIETKLTSYKEDIRDPRWIETMKAEIDALQTNYTRDIVDFKSQGKNKPVCRLIKSLYGLKEASRQWNAKLTEALLRNQFQQSQLDHSLFIKRTSEKVIIVLVYVDDMAIIGDNLKLIVETKTILQQTFKMKDLGDMKYFLGIEFTRSKKGVLMHQRKYVLELISEVGLSAAKPAITPLDTNIKLTIVLGHHLIY